MYRVLSEVRSSSRPRRTQALSQRFTLLYLLNLLLVTSTRKVSSDGEAKDYTFPDSVNLHDGDEFEYIVVGAGTGGSAVASRLALAGARVLLVEAGGDPTELSKIPGMAIMLQGSSLDYQYKTISNNVSCLSYSNRQCRNSRGKCLGGTTVINHMMYTRGNPQDFDELNITGWTWKDIQPYFLRYEGLQDLNRLPFSSIPFHNTSGTMKLGFFSDSGNPWHPRLIEGMKSLNLPFNPDVNARSQIGVTKVVGYVYNGERMSTARGYLARDDVKRKLKVAKHTKCTGVIIDMDNVARGVTVVDSFSPFHFELRLYATKEVILSAGTVATPQILMLSGIGPVDHLRDMQVPVLVDLSVGSDMFDHVAPLIFIKVENKTRDPIDLLSIAAKMTGSLANLLLHRDGPLASIGLTDVTAFVNTMCYNFDKRQLTNESTECQVPTSQFIFAYADRYILTTAGPIAQHGTDLDDAVFKQLSAINKNYAIIIVSPMVLNPKSRGSVRLASRDPVDAPAIFPNYISDDLDLEEMVRSIRITEHLVETPVFKAHNASIAQFKLSGCPDYESDSDGYRGCYARHMTQSIFHSAGTCALGRVVDSRLRVRGVRRLRVADLSVLPRPTRANTAAIAIAIGERAADLVLEDNQ